MTEQLEQWKSPRRIEEERRRQKHLAFEAIMATVDAGDLDLQSAKTVFDVTESMAVAEAELSGTA